MSKISLAEAKDLNQWFNDQEKQNGFVDMEKRIIKGKSGKLYKIAPENITAGRWSEYTVQTIQLSFSTTFQSIMVKMSKAITTLRNTTGFGAVIDTAKILEEIIDGMNRVELASAPDIIKYCSIFCIGKDEDTRKYDPMVVQEKFEDWSHIPIKDFFLLATDQIASLNDLRSNMKRGHKAVEIMEEISKVNRKE